MVPYEIGDAVTCVGTNPARTGHVTRIRHTKGLELFDVTFERETAHGLLAEELSRAGTQEIRAMLAGLALEAQALLEGSADPSPSTLRDLLLIQEQTSRFEANLAGLSKRLPKEQALTARFAPEDVVALRDRDGWALATVLSVTRGQKEALYDLEVEGELERHDEGELVPLADVVLPHPLHVALGQRACLSTSGHAADPSFTGTVCRITLSKGTYELALAFDDGDVFLGLSPEDLVPLDG